MIALVGLTKYKELASLLDRAVHRITIRRVEASCRRPRTMITLASTSSAQFKGKKINTCSPMHMLCDVYGCAKFGGHVARVSQLEGVSWVPMR